MRFFFIILVFIATTTQAQVADTLFFDMNGNTPKKRKLTVLYRVGVQDGAGCHVKQYYYQTGILQMTGTYTNCNYHKAHGLFTWYNAAGKLQRQGNYENNLRTGLWKSYDDDGKLAMEEYYVKGKLEGDVLIYDTEGRIAGKKTYKNNKCVFTESFERALKTGLLLRGKALGFVIIEDDWVFNFTCGAEYRFAKHHAFGAEYYFFRWRHEQEQYPDPTKSDYVEYSSYNPRNSLLVDYRFYFPFSLTRKASIRPYMQAYYRFGNARTYHQPQYQVDSAGTFRQWEKFYDIGFTTGLHCAVTPRGKLGLDICLGAYQRTKTQETIEHYNPSGTNWFTHEPNSSEWLPIFRINLFCYLWGKHTSKKNADVERKP
ncbi:MAG TPA: hypothetical protein VK177_02010 [Flavobacteriales bacterium]|nr:hypothetical protein [Flavobacteriales bacterium]